MPVSPDVALTGPGRSQRFIQVQRRQRQSWLMVDPLMISFRRPLAGTTPDGAGGRSITANTISLAPQLCRIVPSRSRSANQIIVSGVGQIVVSKDETLVGAWDLDIQQNDLFTWEYQDYQVSFIYSDRRWETQAQLDLMGQNYRQTI